MNFSILRSTISNGKKSFLINSRNRLNENQWRLQSQSQVKVNDEQYYANEELEQKKKNRIDPLKCEDYFGVRSSVNIKDLFDAGVHYGHKDGSLDERMGPYVFGSRLGHLIFDLEKTAQSMRDALNFTAHVAYRDGVILFASNYHQHCNIIEKTAVECGEFAHTREFHTSLFTNSQQVFKATIRLPDLCIILNTLNDVLAQHPIVIQAAKLNIPTIGIVDTNCDPNLITYPVPGNDDSPRAIELYCRLFKNAILKGKEYRKRDLEKYY